MRAGKPVCRFPSARGYLSFRVLPPPLRPGLDADVSAPSVLPAVLGCFAEAAQEASGGKTRGHSGVRLRGSDVGMGRDCGDAAVLAGVTAGGRTARLGYFCPMDPARCLVPALCPSAGAGARCRPAFSSAPADETEDVATVVSALEIARFSSRVGGMGFSGCQPVAGCLRELEWWLTMLWEISGVFEAAVGPGGEVGVHRAVGAVLPVLGCPCAPSVTQAAAGTLRCPRGGGDMAAP